MYVNREAGLAYLAPPRTASMATAHTLQHQAGFETVAGHHGTNCDLLEDVYAFTVVRNHWDTMVSWHCGGHGDPGALTTERLGEIVANLGGYLPEPTRLWGLHAPAADRLVRYETLRDGLNRVLLGFGLPAVEVPERNVSTGRKRRSYEGFYDEPSREWVRHRFFHEISEIGYTF